ncbi:MAG: hypothetical protein EBT92_05015 [Planctomycetes bacterium]|nr:hypothetical protein [Planctomycetota bacterium]
MKSYTLLTAIFATFILSGTVEAAKTKPTKGTILKAQQDSGKESGTITVKVTPKKKKGDTSPAPATAEEKSFKISETTKLETVSGKKKDTTSTPAKFSDLKEGSAVLIASNKKSVDSVKITKAKKTKAKKKTAA